MSNFEYAVLKKHGCGKPTIAAYKRYQRLACTPNKNALWEVCWHNFVNQDNGFGLAVVAINLIAEEEVLQK